MISTSVVVDDDHFKDENHSYSLLSNSLENIYPEEAVQYWTSDLCIFHSRAYAGGWESIMESFAQILCLFLDYSSLDHQKMLKLWKWCLGNTELRTPQIWEKYRICECVNSRMPPGNKQIFTTFKPNVLVLTFHTLIITQAKPRLSSLPANR